MRMKMTVQSTPQLITMIRMESLPKISNGLSARATVAKKLEIGTFITSRWPSGARNASLRSAERPPWMKRRKLRRISSKSSDELKRKVKLIPLSSKKLWNCHLSQNPRQISVVNSRSKTRYR